MLTEHFEGPISYWFKNFIIIRDQEGLQITLGSYYTILSSYKLVIFLA